MFILCSFLRAHKLVRVAAMCSLNIHLNSVIPITFKPLIQYTSRRWVLKINSCRVLIRLLRDV